MYGLIYMGNEQNSPRHGPHAGRELRRHRRRRRRRRRPAHRRTGQRTAADDHVPAQRVQRRRRPTAPPGSCRTPGASYPRRNSGRVCHHPGRRISPARSPRRFAVAPGCEVHRRGAHRGEHACREDAQRRSTIPGEREPHVLQAQIHPHPDARGVRRYRADGARRHRRPSIRRDAQLHPAEVPGLGLLHRQDPRHEHLLHLRQAFVVAYYKCRTKNGTRPAGRCTTTVRGFRCTEKRESIATEIDARVTCRRGTQQHRPHVPAEHRVAARAPGPPVLAAGPAGRLSSR